MINARKIDAIQSVQHLNHRYTFIPLLYHFYTCIALYTRTLKIIYFLQTKYPLSILQIFLHAPQKIGNLQCCLVKWCMASLNLTSATPLTIIVRISIITPANVLSSKNICQLSKIILKSVHLNDLFL